MKSPSIESRLFALFANNNPSLYKNLPSKIIEDCKNLSNERTMCINKRDLPFLMKDTSNFTSRFKRIKIYSDNRNLQEFFGPDIQIIVAACIHTDRRILMLKLAKDCAATDGYHKGTLTYPQGHIVWRKNMSLTKNQLRDIFVANLFRELNEELKITIPFKKSNIYLKGLGGDYDGDTLFNKACFPIFHDLINKCQKIYPIYINKPGTTSRHVCMLFDIDIGHEDYHEYFTDHLISNLDTGEPKKHEIAWMSYNDLLQIKNIDDICPWVTASFSMLPFMRKDFIQDYPNA